MSSLDSMSVQANASQKEMRLSQTFSQVLDKNLQRSQGLSQSTSKVMDFLNPSQLSFASNKTQASSDEPPVRNSAVNELRKEAKSLGVPLNTVTVRPEDSGRLKKDMEDSGYEPQDVEKVMKELSKGPMTMDKVLALVGKPKTQEKDALTITEESLPYIGQFLTDLGMGAEQVKEVLGTLQPGQKFSAEEFRGMLLQNTDQNLRGVSLANVDAGNLKSMLTSLGVKPEAQAPLWNLLQKTNGGLSLEGLTSFLKSVEQPSVLNSDALENVRQLVDNLQMANTLKVQPYFDRIVCMLDGMGDKDIDETFLKESPAIQALRSGSTAVNSILNGSGAMGGEDNSSQSNMGQGNWTQSETKLTDGENTSRAAESNVSYRANAAMAKEIAEKMVLSAGNQQNRLRIQLTPKEMGRLDISLVMKNNNVHASIVADNPMAKQALQDHMSQLKQTLADHGLDLVSFDVSLSSDQQSDNPAERWAFMTNKANGTSSPELQEETTQNVVNLRSPHSLVDRHI
ncbi:MAG: flagellar hook-length control protein FliK [Deltaproteobacteria bacterium]|nr:flagellar hook-length control protein FliK [Deltaproteobacteria bacterium]